MRKVVVLFVHLRELREEPDIIRTQECVTTIQSVLRLSEGTLRQFIVDDKGCVLIAAFGLPPLSHEDDPTRALHAALEIKVHLKRLRVTASIGITTGRCFCGVVGTVSTKKASVNDRKEYAMVGAVVNTAARLMSMGNGQIICDEATYLACRDAFLIDVFAKDVMLKGKSDAVTVYKVAGKKSASQNRTPLFGALGSVEVIIQSIEDVAHSSIPRDVWCTLSFFSGEQTSEKTRAKTRTCPTSGPLVWNQSFSFDLPSVFGLKMNVSVFAKDTFISDFVGEACVSLPVEISDPVVDYVLPLTQPSTAMTYGKLTMRLVYTVQAQRRAYSDLALVGRGREIGQISRKLSAFELEMSPTARRAVMVLHGEAGIGKSRLASLFLELCKGETLAAATAPAGAISPLDLPASGSSSSAPEASQGTHRLSRLLSATSLKALVDISGIAALSDPQALVRPKMRAVRVQCAAIEQSAVYACWRSIVAALCGLEQFGSFDSDPTAVRLARDHVARIFADAVPEFGTVASLLNPLLPFDYPTSTAVAKMSKEAAVAKTNALCLALLRTLSKKEALILVIEDVQNMDLASQLLLLEIVRHLLPVASTQPTNSGNGSGSATPEQKPQPLRVRAISTQRGSRRGRGSESPPRTRLNSTSNVTGTEKSTPSSPAKPANASPSRSPKSVPKTASEESPHDSPPAHPGLTKEGEEPLSNIFIFLTYRPTHHHSHQEALAAVLKHEGIDHIALAPMSDVEVAELAQSVLVCNNLPAPALTLLKEKGMGNPFYTLELALSMQAQGYIVVDSSGKCTLSSSANDISLPQTIHDIVLSRVDRLPPLAQFVLKVASVIGITFAPSLLLSIYPIEEQKPHVMSQLEHLRDLGMVEPVGDRHSFKNAVIQEVAYSLLTDDDRKPLHAAVVRFFEYHKSNLTPYYSLLARHSMSAGDAPKALAYWERAARHSVHIDNQTALSCLNSLIDFAAKNPQPSFAAVQTFMTPNTPRAGTLTSPGSAANGGSAHVASAGGDKDRGGDKGGAGAGAGVERVVRGGGVLFTQARLASWHKLRGLAHFDLGQVAPCLADLRTALELVHQSVPSRVFPSHSLRQLCAKKDSSGGIVKLFDLPMLRRDTHSQETPEKKLFRGSSLADLKLPQDQLRDPYAWTNADVSEVCTVLARALLCGGKKTGNAAMCAVLFAIKVVDKDTQSPALRDAYAAAGMVCNAIAMHEEAKLFVDLARSVCPPLLTSPTGSASATSTPSVAVRSFASSPLSAGSSHSDREKEREKEEKERSEKEREKPRRDPSLGTNATLMEFASELSVHALFGLVPWSQFLEECERITFAENEDPLALKSAVPLRVYAAMYQGAVTTVSEIGKRAYLSAGSSGNVRLRVFGMMASMWTSVMNGGLEAGSSWAASDFWKELCALEQKTSTTDSVSSVAAAAATDDAELSLEVACVLSWGATAYLALPDLDLAKRAARTALLLLSAGLFRPWLEVYVRLLVQAVFNILDLDPGASSTMLPVASSLSSLLGEISKKYGILEPTNLFCRAFLKWHEGQHGEAQIKWKQSAEAAAALGMPLYQGFALYSLGLFLKSDTHLSDARQIFLETQMTNFSDSIFDDIVELSQK
eukprot:TRINITY_DN3703_c0_g1_i1.p1 TRINITY_DN3703_c0_g1~~TRINITY_DN3703_c0_g1_i1.p1  ORF type:complete len:1880 (+),score=473.42 TRINITY_DN3703_c0_g1_i1:814-5640(+)